MKFSLQAHTKSKVSHENMREISVATPRKAAAVWTSGSSLFIAPH
jgi:hypothetical protein